MARRPERLIAWLSSACLVVVVLSAGVAGIASTRVTQEQARAAHLVAVAGRMPALAGRIEALVAIMADPRTDPARLSTYRMEVRRAAEDLLLIAEPGGRDDDGVEGTGLRAADSVRLADAVAAGNPGLVQRLRIFCAAAIRAARPGADLKPGSLIRGDIDGETAGPLITDLNAVVEAIAADSSERSMAWHRMVWAGGIGLCLVTAALVWIMLGPLAGSLRRARLREQQSLAEREAAATYLEQLLDGLDVAVLATDAADRVTANSAARLLFGLPDSQLSAADLHAAASRLLDGRRVPIAEQATGIAHLLTGGHGEQELLLLPAQAEPQGARQLMIRSLVLGGRGVQRLGTVVVAHDVTDLHTRHQLLARQAAQLAAIDDATRAILREPDARAAVCQAAATASHGIAASLFEPDGHGDLVCTAAFGIDALGVRMSMDRPSMVVETFTSGRTKHLVRANQHPGVDHMMLSRLSEILGQEITAGIWVPVINLGRSVGVLVVGFDPDTADLADQIPVLEILAAEAAVAMERQDLLLRLEAEAGSDALTGAANRRTWEVRLPAAIDQAARTDHSLAVIILDLDHFKAYNDAHGHPAGDALLRHLVTTWSARIRPSDVLARYGGEEFAVLLPNCDAAGAARLANELRALVPADQTCSAGVATWVAGDTAHTLIARADNALYAAKRAGRNQTVTA
jgi:diguanylate cyclase (GGDEF)-like protein